MENRALAEKCFHGFGIKDREAAYAWGRELQQAVLQESEGVREEVEYIDSTEEVFHSFGIEDREVADANSGELQQRTEKQKY